MKKPLYFLMINLLIALGLSCSQNDNHIDIREFYIMDFTSNGDNISLRAKPNNLTGDEQYAAFGEKMYNALDCYLLKYSNYDVEYFESILPDTSRINAEFNELINNDSLLKVVTTNTLLMKDFGSVSIDSLMKIFSRLYYLHKTDSRGIVVHTCLANTEIFDLPQTEISPYLNAFCWEVARTNNIWGMLTDDFNWGDQLDENISDIELDSIRENNYLNVQRNDKVVETIISEYEKRKDLLNFKLEY